MQYHPTASLLLTVLVMMSSGSYMDSAIDSAIGQRDILALLCIQQTRSMRFPVSDLPQLEQLGL